MLPTARQRGDISSVLPRRRWIPPLVTRFNVMRRTYCNEDLIFLILRGLLFNENEKVVNNNKLNVSESLCKPPWSQGSVASPLI